MSGRSEATTSAAWTTTATPDARAARNSDPQRNAELMKTLHLAQDSLDAARRALNHAQGVAVLFGTQLLGLLPEAEPVAKVA